MSRRKANLWKIKRRRKEIFLNRLLLCLGAIILITIFSIGLCSGFAEAYEPRHSLSETAEMEIQKSYKSIELSYGDTLWKIAERYMDDSYDSIYDYIDDLKEINGLTSDEIHAGHYLTVVYSASYL